MTIDDGHDLDAVATPSWADFSTTALRAGKRRIDEAFAFIDFASIAKLDGQISQNCAQNFTLAPLLKGNRLLMMGLDADSIAIGRL